MKRKEAGDHGLGLKGWSGCVRECAACARVLWMHVACNRLAGASGAHAAPPPCPSAPPVPADRSNIVSSPRSCLILQRSCANGDLSHALMHACVSPQSPAASLPSDSLHERGPIAAAADLPLATAAGPGPGATPACASRTLGWSFLSLHVTGTFSMLALSALRSSWLFRVPHTHTHPPHGHCGGKSLWPLYACMGL